MVLSALKKSLTETLEEVAAADPMSPKSGMTHSKTLASKVKSVARSV